MRAEKPGAAGDEDPLLYRLHGIVLVVLGFAAGQPITRRVGAAAVPGVAASAAGAAASAPAGLLGRARIRSVFGLKVRRSAPKVSPSTLPPQASTTRRAMLRFRASLTRNTVSTIASGAFISSAVRTKAWQSFGKHEPPKPGPACRNLPPMRPSRPMPRATSCTSAPTASQRSATSLMKVIFVARKALAAYLISSAVSSVVNTIGVSNK